MVLETCPFCHLPFEAKAIAREEVDESDLTRQQLTPKGAGWAIRGARFGPGRFLPSGPRNPEAVLTYKVTYKCHHCGKEWSKIEAKDEGLPEEYSESGFD